MPSATQQLWLMRLLVTAVVLPIVDKVLDALNVWTFWERGDTWWALLTVGVVLLPGLCEVVFWSIELAQGNAECSQAMAGICVFGPLFPITTIVWHCKLLCYAMADEDGMMLLERKFAKSMVFKSLQAFTEAALQLLLQVTILIMTWKGNELHIFQLMCAHLSLLFLSVTATEHHFHEMSGKERVRMSLAEMRAGLLFFAPHVVGRTLVLAYLAAYLRGWFFLVVLVLLVLNYACAACVLGSEDTSRSQATGGCCGDGSVNTDRSKAIWTVLSAVLVPTCFVSRDTIRDYKLDYLRPGDVFLKFYLFNSVTFGLVTLLAMGLLHASMEHFPIDYGCEALPFLSCLAPSSSSTAEDMLVTCASRRACAPDEDPHYVALIVGWVVVGGLNAISIVVVTTMYFLREGDTCGTFLGQKLFRTSAERQEEAEF